MIEKENKEFSPERFIDREAEREIFKELTKFQDARLLTICDKGGSGKSSLLHQLKYDCGWIYDPPILASLVPLEQLSDQIPFALVAKIKKELTSFADELDQELRFPRFNRLNDALRAKDYEPFSTLIEFRSHNTEIQSASGKQTGDDILAWRPHNPTADTKVWNTDKEDTARRECIRAFFEDLRQICDTQRVILLLDTWERSESVLQEWIISRIVRSLCFNRETRPTNFSLVLAGRELPNFKQRLGDEDRYKELVRSIESLGSWEVNHVKHFLQANGYEDLSKEDFSVELIYDRLRSGLSLVEALQLANLIQKQG
jgi:hypothetical protein